jgi:murein DD-endopeptidase MepM/ murein hydrolase activator NlpD
MRRLALVLTAALGLAATCAGAAHAQTFVVIAPGQERLPSYEVPNAPGSIRVPSPLSRPPARPAVLSYSELVALWRRAGSGYGVPWQVLGAINKIESNFGRNMGPSSAGALGWMQFIPSSWMRWGMDADANGIADPWDPEDAVFSAARYLAAAGAHEDLERAIFAYNHADWYVDDVLELAKQFGGDSVVGSFGLPGSGVAFDVDGLEQELADARRAVTRARRAIPSLEESLENVEWDRLALEQRAGDPSISDGEFARLEAQIAALEDREANRWSERQRREQTLADAEARVSSLEAELAAALSGTGSTDSPDSVDGYVFPVGGGPKRVSVAHDHHDYPAADIAAPEGSPVYALASGTILETYSNPYSRCGLGLKLDLDAGPTYVYCHLAYVEPSLAPAVAVSAGASVGLVGSTGNSTGPHLHLQYVPATAYPQEEPWFQSFAGRAFSWQDAPTPRVRKRDAGPLFRVVRMPAETAPVQVIAFTP